MKDVNKDPILMGLALLTGAAIMGVGVWFVPEPATAIEAAPTTVHIYVDKVERFGDHAEVNSRNEIERQSSIRSAMAATTPWEYTGLKRIEYRLPGTPYPLEHFVPCYTLKEETP